MADQECFQGFPWEIIVNIILCLPAESLVTMMLVCKQWYALIKEANFILQHFEVSGLRGNDYTLYGPRILIRPDCLKFLGIKGKVIPNCFDSFCCLMVNSCNGLVCLTDFDEYGTIIYLLNPFIRKCRVICTSSLGTIYPSEGEFKFFVLGFGFHTPNNDHKIIRIAYANNGNPLDNLMYDVAVELYSLSTDSWERIEVGSFPWLMSDNYSRTSIHERVHWIVLKRGDEPIILSFDFCSHKFEDINFPNNIHIEASEYHSECLLLIKKSSLSLGLVYLNPETNLCTIWKMDKYGVVESWEKMAQIHVFCDSIHRPLTSTRTDGIVFEDFRSGKVYFWNFNENDLNSCQTYNLLRQTLDFVVVRNSLFLLEEPPENGDIYARLQN